MLNALSSLLSEISSFLWSGPLLLLLAAVHIFFTLRLHPQRYTLRAIRLSVTPDKKENKGLSGFATLATTLAATLGTGNIVGVSTAIALGGPGALFWCFLTGLFGMATAYAECYLGCLYQGSDKNGDNIGGPMYVLEKGLHSRFLGKCYALCVTIAAVGAGCTIQSSAIADAAASSWRLSPHIAGMAAAVLTGLVILGGISSIGSFCSRLVPPLSFLYMGACCFLMWLNRGFLWEALCLICSSAFTGRAAGGGFVGSTILLSARFGIARGLFTNEAGIGTAAITAGASGAEPKRQALISMTAVFWDTIVMCTLTGLTIVSSILAHPDSLTGYSEAGLTSAAFAYLPLFGNSFLTVSLIAFAIATLVGWCYLGEKGVVYLFGENSIHSYRLVYIVMIYLGAILPLKLIWNFSDLINAVMVLPNVLCLLLLAKKIQKPY